MTVSIRENLEQHLKQIVRDRNPFLASEGHFYAKEYIREEFGKFATIESHFFQVKGKIHENLILRLSSEGEFANQPPILIGAHYDTVPGSPGADDNASGVAVLLELARLLSQEKRRFPVILAAFDLEEYGYLGSQAYAAYLQQQKQPLRLMLSLEMLGYCDRTPNSQQYPPGLQYFYPSTGNFIALVGNLASIPDLRHLCHYIRQNNTPCEWLPVPLRGFVVPATRRSDHVPFWDRGDRAIMVTDTANFRNPYYHTAKDTLETLDLDFLTGVCQGLALGIQLNKTA